MFTQEKKNVFDLIWNNSGMKYRDIFHQAEKEYSAYNFEYANTENLFKMFDMFELEANSLIEKKISFFLIFLVSKQIPLNLIFGYFFPVDFKI